MHLRPQPDRFAVESDLLLTARFAMGLEVVLLGDFPIFHSYTDQFACKDTGFFPIKVQLKDKPLSPIRSIL
nr:MAG TPA: hypothetical protein [Caudoviricetes sp.]